METYYKDLDQVNPAGPFSSATHFAGWTPEERSFMDEDTPLFTKADYAKMATAVVIVSGVLIASVAYAGVKMYKKLGERAPKP